MRALACVVCLQSSQVMGAPLADVVRHVLDTHPDVVSARALLDAANERIRQSRSEYLPTAGLSYENSGTTEEISGASIDRDTSRLDATLRWNLFRGFADRGAISSATARKAASASELEDVREALALKVLEVYLDVQRNRALVEVSAAQIESLEALAQRVGKRAELGRISRVTVHQANTRLVQARNRHIQLRAALSGSELRFREITGMTPDDLVLPVLDEQIADVSIDVLYQRAIDGNPRIQAARETARSRAADIDVARGGLMPTVDLELRKRLFADVEPDSSIDLDTSVRLVVNYDFPLGGASLSRKSEAVSLKSAAEQRVASLEREVRADVAAVSRQLVEDRNIAANLEANVAAAEAVVKAYHLQFDAGKRTLLDLLTAYADLYQAEAAVLDNRFRQLASTARIYYQLGLLQTQLLP
jgi:TolC family type I secretion outer membrane protein